mmetsp:Transcript_32727/g.101217  ORF Transcript_32727/g.101217 Transcript_32727/m.101217 type:complete len:85 (-) Transcript_32727:2494-2748(-)
MLRVHRRTDQLPRVRKRDDDGNSCTAEFVGTDAHATDDNERDNVDSDHRCGTVDDHGANSAGDGAADNHPAANGSDSNEGAHQV